MISPLMNSTIRTGTHVYQVSCEKKTCKPGIVIRKSDDDGEVGLLVKLYDGHFEYVEHINGVEDNDGDKPGWYIML